jgi:4'-phosphopantetheinyl transferase
MSADSRQSASSSKGALANTPPTLGPDDVHIWRIALDGGDIDRDRAWLSSDELARADRFVQERDRTHYEAGRAALRGILAGYLGSAPDQLGFSYARAGKPALAGGWASSGIQFNLSHSQAVGLLAVSRERSLGIDIEWMNPATSVMEICERFFSAGEISTLRGLPDDQKVAGFFQCWTRKEAFIKAVGEGLSIPLDSFDVSFGSEPAALKSVRAEFTDVARWKLYDLPIDPEYAAALAAEGNHHKLSYLRWNHR